VKLFLYFGHEIPNSAERATMRRTRIDVQVDDLAGPLERMTRDSTKVDSRRAFHMLRRTPRTVAAVAPYARYVIASPTTCISHTSISSRSNGWTSVCGREMCPVFANAFARNAFDKLTGDIQTAVSVVVYDVDRVREFLHSVDSIYITT